MKSKFDPERVRLILEWLGARLLHDEPDRPIELSHEIVREIAGILSSLPEGRIGRPKAWTFDTEINAIFDMLGGKSVEDTARAIAEETGQHEASAIRRLWELRDSPRFKNWRP